MVARITGAPEHFEIAATTARKVLAMTVAIPRHMSTARAGLALLAAECNDVAAATELYPALEPLRGTMFVYVSGDRLLGLLSATMGDLDRAVAHFEDALALSRRGGYRPEYAWTCYDYANSLLAGVQGRAPFPGDRDKAESLLEEALAISQELGMLPLMERVAAFQKGLEPSPDAAQKYPNGLSQREVEVLRLVARGESNRRIAGELVITEATVRRHVSNIYGKISVSNRAEATRYALKEGLLSLDGGPSSSTGVPTTPAGNGPGP